MERWEYRWVELGSFGLSSYVWTDDRGRIEPFRAKDFASAVISLLGLFREEGWSLVRSEDSSYVFKRARAESLPGPEPGSGGFRAQAVRQVAAPSHSS